MDSLKDIYEMLKTEESRFTLDLTEGDVLVLRENEDNRIEVYDGDYVLIWKEGKAATHFHPDYEYEEIYLYLLSIMRDRVPFPGLALEADTKKTTLRGVLVGVATIGALLALIVLAAAISNASNALVAFAVLLALGLTGVLFIVARRRSRKAKISPESRCKVQEYLDSPRPPLGQKLELTLDYKELCRSFLKGHRELIISWPLSYYDAEISSLARFAVEAAGQVSVDDALAQQYEYYAQIVEIVRIIHTYYDENGVWLKPSMR